MPGRTSRCAFSPGSPSAVTAALTPFSKGLCFSQGCEKSAFLSWRSPHLCPRVGTLGTISPSAWVSAVARPGQAEVQPVLPLVWKELWAFLQPAQYVINELIFTPSSLARDSAESAPSMCALDFPEGGFWGGSQG